MRPFLTKRTRTVLPVPVLLAALTASGVAAEPGFSLRRLGPEKACAAFDLHYLTLIEDHGRAQEIAPDVIHDAAIKLLEARVACRAGDYGRALRLYDRLALDPPGVAPSHWVVMR